MRIGFDISPLVGGHAGRGTGTYTRLLLDGLKQYGKDLEIVEFGQNKPLSTFVDLIHYPYFDPFLLTLPIQKSKPTVVTVHDLIPIAYAKHFPRGVKGELKWQVQRYSLRSASAILTDSVASKNDIVSLVPFDKDKVSVVYLAPGKEFTLKSKNDQERVRAKYRLPRQYMLYVGDVNWNKNIPGLIHAAEQIDVSLVLVGKAFLDDNIAEVQELNSLINSLSVNDRIVRLGLVLGDDLAAIYSAAGVYVQPSYAEGFGLPVLESMACGTIPVVANATSLKEIAGPSILVDPNYPKDIAGGIKKALSLNKEAYIDKLIAWVKTYTWEKTAKETVEVYKSIVS
jgi:glycosyltransferase involved in cell wall biosynthesis